MTAQPDWGQTYISKVKMLITLMEDCRVQRDMLVGDPELAKNFLDHSNSNRPDLVPDDFLNANSALSDMITTWDNGNTSSKAAAGLTNKGALFKII